MAGILHEAGKPCITQELDERKKQRYVAANTWPIDGPLHNRMKEICTKETVEKLGFVDWKVVWGRALDKAFRDDADNMVFRVLLLVGSPSWVMVVERCNVKQAEWDSQMPVGGI